MKKILQTRLFLFDFKFTESAASLTDELKITFKNPNASKQPNLLLSNQVWIPLESISTTCDSDIQENKSIK